MLRNQPLKDVDESSRQNRGSDAVVSVRCWKDLPPPPPVTSLIGFQNPSHHSLSFSLTSSPSFLTSLKDKVNPFTSTLPLYRYNHTELHMSAGKHALLTGPGARGVLGEGKGSIALLSSTVLAPRKHIVLFLKISLSLS